MASSSSYLYLSSSAPFHSFAKSIHSSSSSSSRCSSSVSSLPTSITCSSSSLLHTVAPSQPSCSRRHMLGLAGLLATLGLGVTPPQADAASASCGDYNVTPSGLAFCDTSVGNGIPATKGLLIKAHYSGRLENGSEFDSSYKRGKPLTFRIGVGEVIRGWDQGILGAEGIPPMQAGGKRTLKVPASLGYGERGAGCRLGSCLIPPNSTLIFDVEFVGKA